VTVVCPAGSGNITGGGNTLTLGAGGSCNAITITNSPVFTTSVTSPIFQGSGSMALKTLATAGADDIVFSTAGTQVATILENGNFGIGVTGPTAKLQVDGTTLVKTTTDTVSAFEIQDSSSDVLLTADTTNQTVSIGVASGGKFISVPASASLNTATTVDTGYSNSAATAYGNQRHLITLSTGRRVAIVAGNGTNGDIRWSDDGTTWADYGADISGWANG
jgi:hypothetical protein